MGKRVCDCARCGAPVARVAREHCWRCTKRLENDRARAQCPGCGGVLVLQPDTGRCIRCSRTCVDCANPVRSPTHLRCSTCRRRHARAADLRPCPRCGRSGHLRPSSGWCGTCSRTNPPKDPPRICAGCGQMRRHAGHGLCAACAQRMPSLPFTRAESISNRLEVIPTWFHPFVAHVAERYASKKAADQIAALGRLLQDGQSTSPAR